MFKEVRGKKGDRKINGVKNRVLSLMYVHKKHE